MLLHFEKYRICSFTNKYFIYVLLLIALVTGCNRTEVTTPEKPEVQGKPIQIGLIPERNIINQIERYNPLADYISERLGRKVELNVLTRYGNIIDNFNTLGLDGAFFGSFTYALARAKLGVVPLARPENMDGTSTYYGMMFTRKDSGIRTAKDMKGKVFAFVDRATTAGYLLPLAYFRENGIMDYRAFFKETYFTGTHDDAIYDVLNGRADVGAAKNTIFFSLDAADKRLKEELIILTRSPDVPENGLAVRKDLDSAVKARIKEILLGMHTEPDGKKVLKTFGAKRFLETADNDYSAVHKYIREIGLDLQTYQYINK
jgi:phosphonate transport system substrate-binding protein